MKIEAKNFRSHKSGALQGYVDLFLPELGWTLKGCGVFASSSREWITSPSKQYKDDNGETKYSPILEMPKDKREAFSDEAMKALKRLADKPPIQEDECPF